MVNDDKAVKAEEPEDQDAKEEREEQESLLEELEIELSSPKIDLEKMAKEIKNYDRMIRRCEQRMKVYERKLAVMHTQQDEKEKSLMDKALGFFNLKSDIRARS